VLSNPPYIPAEQMPGLQAEVGQHEPWSALDGGPGEGLHSLQVRQCVASACSVLMQPALRGRQGPAALRMCFGSWWGGRAPHIPGCMQKCWMGDQERA
jgi:methylase of polypeptide subunit release factors